MTCNCLPCSGRRSAAFDAAAHEARAIAIFARASSAVSATLARGLEIVPLRGWMSEHLGYGPSWKMTIAEVTAF